MTVEADGNASEFDDYAERYDEALSLGISVSGEDKDYFARGRINWLRGCLLDLGVQPRHVMDYGCGTGSSSQFLLQLIGAESVIGVDTSARTLGAAKRKNVSGNARFLLLDEYQPNQGVDLAYCNGVFHHIPVNQRARAIDYVYRSLRPGGIFALWENNPWNPGTRYVMRHIPFDRDAVTLTPVQARRLLCARGYEILRTDYLFIFPRMLRWFRPVEPHVCRFPFGTQYQVLCRKP